MVVLILGPVYLELASFLIVLFTIFKVHPDISNIKKAIHKITLRIVHDKLSFTLENPSGARFMRPPKKTSPKTSDSKRQNAPRAARLTLKKF
jgi:hypothetical protein